MTVSPRVTCPSPARATFPSLRTQIIVVECICPMGWLLRLLGWGEETVRKAGVVGCGVKKRFLSFHTVPILHNSQWRHDAVEPMPVGVKRFIRKRLTGKPGLNLDWKARFSIDKDAQEVLLGITNLENVGSFQIHRFASRIQNGCSRSVDDKADHIVEPGPENPKKLLAVRNRLRRNLRVLSLLRWSNVPTLEPAIDPSRLYFVFPKLDAVHVRVLQVAGINVGLRKLAFLIEHEEPAAGLHLRRLEERFSAQCGDHGVQELAARRSGLCEAIRAENQKNNKDECLSD